jgi:hypothetical protein
VLAILNELKRAIPHEQACAKARRHREQRGARHGRAPRFTKWRAAGGKSSEDSDLRLGNTAIDGGGIRLGMRAIAGEAQIRRVPSRVMGIKLHRLFNSSPPLIRLAKIGRQR